MGSLNFIGGEKGGVGKSLTARLLAQYFIDRQHPFTGFDTDRSHSSFTRFYADYASPVLMDRFESLDAVVGTFEDTPNQEGVPSVIVDLAAQTAAPLSRWIRESNLLAVLAEIGVSVNFWHVVDGSRESVDLLQVLLNSYGRGPNYVVLKNLGRASDFSLLQESSALQAALACGARVVELAELQEASMVKIDRFSSSFWAAVNHRSGPDALRLLERQRVKSWLAANYAVFDQLPLLG
jgi:hypothetical protein